MPHQNEASTARRNSLNSNAIGMVGSSLSSNSSANNPPIHTNNQIVGAHQPLQNNNDDQEQKKRKLQENSWQNFEEKMIQQQRHTKISFVQKNSPHLYQEHQHQEQEQRRLQGQLNEPLNAGPLNQEQQNDLAIKTPQQNVHVMNQHRQDLNFMLQQNQMQIDRNKQQLTMQHEQQFSFERQFQSQPVTVNTNDIIQQNYSQNNSMVQSFTTKKAGLNDIMHSYTNPNSIGVSSMPIALQQDKRTYTENKQIQSFSSNQMSMQKPNLERQQPISLAGNPQQSSLTDIATSLPSSHVLTPPIMNDKISANASISGGNIQNVNKRNLLNLVSIPGQIVPMTSMSLESDGNQNHNVLMSATSAAALNSKGSSKKSYGGKSVNKEALSKMNPEERKRYDRNLREQQRSSKISQQIKELKVLLSQSNIPFKPNKYSILENVVEYVKQLQSRAIYLDSEHRKLVNSISQTSEIVNNGQTMNETNQSTIDSEFSFVNGINYKGVFTQCSAALGVVSLDGRFLDCNNEFTAVTGLSKSQLKQGSLFNLLSPSDMEDVYIMIGKTLRENDVDSSKDLVPYWRGAISSKHTSAELMINIILIRKSDGMPKYFNCALTTT